MKNRLLFFLAISVLSCSFLLQTACSPKTTKKATTDTISNDVEKPDIKLAAEPMEEVEADAAMDSEALPTIEKIPVDPDIRIGQLPNGLKYYIRKNQKPENRAELRLAVNAGSMQEDEDQRGLAHFVEHMCFNGSKHFKKSELVDYLETVGTRFGPDLNAYTSFDETVYMLQVRTDDQELLSKGLLILEDWAGAVSFDHEEIDKERGVVESEWRTRLSANQRMQNEYFPVMYQGSRYAERLPIGKPEIIKGASYETVKRFYRDWYRPNLMAVVVVGDFEVDMMEQEIIDRFSKLTNPENERPRKKYEVPDHEETLVSICSDKEASFTNVQLMYKHDNKETTNMLDYRDRIIQRLYNSMLGARLDEIAQQPDPPYNFAYTGYSRDVGDLATYSSYAMAPEGGAERCLEVILTENERVLRHGFTKTELERQKKELLNNMERALKEKDKTDSRRLAMRYVYNYLDNNPIPSIDDEVGFYKKLLPTIGLKNVNKLAKQWITNENRVVVITGPEKADSPMPTEAKVRQILDEVKTKEIKPYVDQVNDAPLLAAELAPVDIIAEQELPKLGVTELTLANGVKIALKPTDFQNDQIMLQASSPGGTSLYSMDDYFSARSAAALMNESGVGEFDITALQKKLAGKTVRLNAYIGELYEGMNGSSSVQDFETLLQLVYLGFTAPRKDEKALLSYKAKQAAIYKNLTSNPQFYFFDLVSKISSNDHPRSGFPGAEDLEKINLDRAYAIYQERFADASDFRFILVGNFEVAQIKPLLATYLGNLPNMKRSESWKDVGRTYPEGKVDKMVKKGKAPKTFVNVIYHGPFNWKDGQKRYEFQSLIDVIKIKMRESMREDKGGVYGVSVRGNVSKYPKEQYRITISFNADPGMARELIETAEQDIATAKEIGAAEKDLNKVKETQRQGRIKNLKENRFWMRSLQSLYNNEADLERITLEHYEQYINGLSAEAVKQMAKLVFDPNRRIEVVMEPEVEQKEEN